MPYFDNRTYEITRAIEGERNLRSYAEEFYKTCRRDRSYPRAILNSEKNALESGNRNEIIVMADATTKWARHMEEAFDAELKNAASRESLFELLCVMLAGLYRCRFGDYRWRTNSGLKVKVNTEIKKYTMMFGEADFLFLDRFKETRLREMQEQQRQEEEALKESIAEREEALRLEQIFKEQKQAERAAESAKKRAEQKERQAKRNAERQRELEAFRKLPLAGQLETIVLNKPIPTAYEMDFGSVSDEALEAVPRDLLVKVVTSFRNVKDAGWKDLQKRAERILGR